MSDVSERTRRHGIAGLVSEVLPVRPPLRLPARFALELRPHQDPADVRASVRERLRGLDARVTPLSQHAPDILVLELPGRTLLGCPPADAFAVAYALADEFGVLTAEPDLPTAFFPQASDEPGDGVVQPADAARQVVVRAGGGFPPGCWAGDEAALTDKLWALKRVRIPEAWAYSRQQGRPDRGKGIVIAQPDTGLRPHQELVGVALVPGYDTVSQDGDPTDPLGFGSAGHGTGTASVLVSPETLQIVGAAPFAKLMAIRAVESIYQIPQITVARAIDWAVAHGAHVISMSLGGVSATALERSLRNAVAADVIVLAAAGNCVKKVVYPARYDDCIAVAGTDSADRPWRGTCRGPAVDIAAPAQNVWRAEVPRGAGPGNAAVGQGEGTSFSVALTGGVAALWLAHKGRTNVITAAHAAGETVQQMFLRLLRATARTPPGWDTAELGAGIVDARALLEAELDARPAAPRAVPRPADPRLRAALTVESLVAEIAGPQAVAGAVTDWHRYGPELVTALLEHQLAGAGRARPRQRAKDGVPPAAVSPQLARAIGNARLSDLIVAP